LSRVTWLGPSLSISNISESNVPLPVKAKWPDISSLRADKFVDPLRELRQFDDVPP
jgi:hypothetical protein